MIDYEPLKRAINNLEAAFSELAEVSKQESGLKQSIGTALVTGDVSEGAARRLSEAKNRLELFPGKLRIVRQKVDSAAKALSAVFETQYQQLVVEQRGAQADCARRVTELLHELACPDQVVRDVLPNILPFSGFVRGAQRRADRFHEAIRSAHLPEDLLAAARVLFSGRPLSNPPQQLGDP
jgi:hypothetical protein